MYSLSRILIHPSIPRRVRHLSTSGSKESTIVALAYTLRRHPKDLPASLRGAPGRDLSERYSQLERSLRRKEVFIKQQEGNQEGTNIVSDSAVDTLPQAPTTAKTIHGFIIPEKPNPPADDECCMSGCAVCVYDLYEDSLESYEETLTSIQSNLRALGVPEAEWPASIKLKDAVGGDGNGGGGQAGERKAQVLSAFEELEKALQAKKA